MCPAVLSASFKRALLSRAAPRAYLSTSPSPKTAALTTPESARSLLLACRRHSGRRPVRRSMSSRSSCIPGPAHCKAPGHCSTASRPRHSGPPVRRARAPGTRELPAPHSTRRLGSWRGPGATAVAEWASHPRAGHSPVARRRARADESCATSSGDRRSRVRHSFATLVAVAALRCCITSAIKAPGSERTRLPHNSVCRSSTCPSCAQMARFASETELSAARRKVQRWPRSTGGEHMRRAEEIGVQEAFEESKMLKVKRAERWETWQKQRHVGQASGSLWHPQWATLPPNSATSPPRLRDRRRRSP